MRIPVHFLYTSVRRDSSPSARFNEIPGPPAGGARRMPAALGPDRRTAGTRPGETAMSRRRQGFAPIKRNRDSWKDSFRVLASGTSRMSQTAAGPHGSFVSVHVRVRGGFRVILWRRGRHTIQGTAEGAYPSTPKSRARFTPTDKKRSFLRVDGGPARDGNGH